MAGQSRPRIVGSRYVPVSLHHVYEVIGSHVAPQRYVCIVDFILSQNALHRFTIQLALRTLRHDDKKTA